MINLLSKLLVNFLPFEGKSLGTKEQISAHSEQKTLATRKTEYRKQQEAKLIHFKDFKEVKSFKDIYFYDKGKAKDKLKSDDVPLILKDISIYNEYVAVVDNERFELGDKKYFEKLSQGFWKEIDTCDFDEKYGLYSYSSKKDFDTKEDLIYKLKRGGKKFIPLSKKIERSSKKAAKKAIADHKKHGNPIYFKEKGILIKEMPDGTRYHVRADSGGIKVIKKL